MGTRVLALFALLVLLCAPACAQREWEKTYGGNGTDRLTDMIATGDGLLAVGYTDSTDGDLSLRTRTGLTGWMLRLDGEGNVLWSCCTARSGRYVMSNPYAHGDGTFSVLLSGEGSGSEWLRVDDEGSVTGRIVLPKPQAACSHAAAKELYGIPLEKDGEPVLALVVTHEDGTNCYTLMREDGTVFPGAQVFPCRADGALEAAIDGSGRLIAVYPEDGDAEIVLIEPGSQEDARMIPVAIDSGKLQLIISALPCRDGSVIFNGQLYAIGNVLLRVNAEGETIFMRDDGEYLGPMTHTQVGFAGVDSDEILFYDEDGALLGARARNVEEEWPLALAALGEGVAVLDGSSTRKLVEISALDDYLPAESAQDWYADALYARGRSVLRYAQTDGADVLLCVEDAGGQTRCLRVSADGVLTDENAPMPDMPPPNTFDLPAGRLTWQAAQRGAVVTLSDAAGNVLWQTFTRIHTPADSVQWFCAAQTEDGRILLGGRYLSQILGDSEEKAFMRELTEDGMMHEGVVVQLSLDGVLLGMDTIRDIGSIRGIAPGKTDGETLLMGTRSALTSDQASNIVPLDQSGWAVLDIMLEPEAAYLLTMPDGSVLAAGTQRRNGKSTVILERVHL